MLRAAFTLIELIVSLAIVAVMLALVASAVSASRSAAANLGSKNKLKLIGLAYQNYCSQNPVKPPGYLYDDVYPGGGFCPIASIIAYLEGEPELEYDRLRPVGRQYWRRGLVHASDRGLLLMDDQRLLINVPTSYSYNMSAFTGRPRLNAVDFADGSSNTIAYAERYGYYPATPSDPAYRYMQYNTSRIPRPGYEGGARRASFADRVWGDPYPVTTGTITVSSQRGITFDHLPIVQDANWHIPQSGTVLTLRCWRPS